MNDFRNGNLLKEYHFHPQKKQESRDRVLDLEISNFLLREGEWMASLPRLYVEGCLQHVVQRGNNRAVCFCCDVDYAFYLQKLKEAAEKYHVGAYAFVLMTNHVHLLVTPVDEDGIKNDANAGASFLRLST